MVFTLDKVVPWGRSFEEYVAMFGLSNDDLCGRILGCGDGPASFNSILTKRGGKVLSVDPLYKFQANDIRNRIKDTYRDVIEQTRKNQDEFVWKGISSIEELGRIRMNAMEDFLGDYPIGVKEGRYVVGALPQLPFAGCEFEIAVCSHFMFLYSAQLSEDFHIQSIIELCRVAKEVRIFPILELGATKSRHLDAVVYYLKNKKYIVTIENVPYEFQKGGNQLLKVIAT